jgi:hypothetical protein
MKNNRLYLSIPILLIGISLLASISSVNASSGDPVSLNPRVLVFLGIFVGLICILILLFYAMMQSRKERRRKRLMGVYDFDALPKIRKAISK